MDAELARLVGGILSVGDPDRIVLFGSRARGDHRPDSDYDVLVIERDRGVGPARRAMELRRATGRFATGLDLLIATPEEAAAWAGSDGHVYGRAQREGLVLHAR